MVYVNSAWPHIHTSIIPRGLVQKVMQDFYHPQYEPWSTLLVILNKGAPGLYMRSVDHSSYKDFKLGWKSLEHVSGVRVRVLEVFASMSAA